MAKEKSGSAARKFECDLCQKSYDRKWELARHEKSAVHKLMVNSEDPMTLSEAVRAKGQHGNKCIRKKTEHCVPCDKWFGGPFHLQRHESTLQHKLTVKRHQLAQRNQVGQRRVTIEAVNLSPADITRIKQQMKNNENNNTNASVSQQRHDESTDEPTVPTAPAAGTNNNIERINASWECPVCLEKPLNPFVVYSKKCSWGRFEDKKGHPVCWSCYKKSPTFSEGNKSRPHRRCHLCRARMEGKDVGFHYIPRQVIDDIREFIRTERNKSRLTFFVKFHARREATNAAEDTPSKRRDADALALANFVLDDYAERQERSDISGESETENDLLAALTDQETDYSVPPPENNQTDNVDMETVAREKYNHFLELYNENLDVSKFCRYCGKVQDGLSKYQRRKHYLSEHRPYLRCPHDLCSYATWRSDSMTAHLRTNIQCPINKTGLPRRHGCVVDGCGFSTDKKVRLSTHMHKHHDINLEMATKRTMKEPVKNFVSFGYNSFLTAVNSNCVYAISDMYHPNRRVE